MHTRDGKVVNMCYIVATCAFGLGINKPDVRFVVRNGLPPSILAWVQEYR